MQDQNQQLTVRQQTLSTKIAKAGNLPKISFARKVLEFKKVRQLNNEDLSQGLAMIFVKVTNLIGLKDPITPNNKADIKEMILMRFSGLSLEEIDYAFKLERYGMLGKKTKHYQLFNSDYVSTILEKYKEWLRDTRSNNNLPIALPEKENKELTEIEKEVLVQNGVIACYNHFVETKEIESGRLWVYDYLYERGLLPDHNKQFREDIKRRATKAIYKRKSQVKSKAESKAIQNALESFKKGGNVERELCKEIVLKIFFGKILGQDKSIDDLI